MRRDVSERPENRRNLRRNDVNLITRYFGYEM